MGLNLDQLCVGDGIQFRDFLRDNFPDLENTCIGRAELSKRSKPSPLLYCSLALIQRLTRTRPDTLRTRQDWACEASFQIYPLYAAIMRYCIDTLILEPNVLRDSILVRLEMTPYECYVRQPSPPNQTSPSPSPTLTPTQPFPMYHL